MSSILSQYLPPDTQALRKEFETACADEIEALYTHFRAKRAIERLEAEKPGILSTPVEQLDLPSRTITALKGHCFDTVVNLLPFTEGDLAIVRGISPETAHKVFSAIDSLLA